MLTLKEIHATDLISEGSFTHHDIPSKFYCVIYFDPKSTNFLEHLAIMRLNGVQGISEAKIIISQFLGEQNREAFLVMPGKETVNLNRLSRVLYDNPDYLVSKNFTHLLRLRNDSNFPGLKRLMEEMMIKVGSELVQNSNEDEPLWVTGKAMFNRTFQSELTHRLSEGEKKINSLRELALWLKAQLFEIGRSEKIRSISIDDLIPPLQEWLEGEAKYVRSEGEWIVKNKTLIIPPQTDLFILIPPIPKYVYDSWKAQTIKPDLLKDYKMQLETFEGILSTIRHYNLDSKFRIRLMNSVKFKQAKERIRNEFEENSLSGGDW